MPSTLIFLLVFFLIDFIYKQNVEKSKKDRDLETGSQKLPKARKKQPTFADLIKSFEEQFQTDDNKAKPKQTDLVEEVVVQPRREGVGSQSRQDRIESQRTKAKQHADFEKNRRLQRDSVLQKARLSDSQVTLASKMTGRNLDDYDLDKKRKLSIDLIKSDQDQEKKRAPVFLNIEKDILKGVIYSEILSKPKSLEKK